MGMERRKMVATGRRKIKRMCESPLEVGEELTRVWIEDRVLDSCEPDILEMWLCRVPLPSFFKKSNACLTYSMHPMPPFPL